MYFTRNAAKRIKVNHDCVDQYPYWVSCCAGSLYEMWLFNLERSFPKFDRRSYIYFEKLICEFYKEFCEQESNFNVDIEFLMNKYPELGMVDDHVDKFLKKRVDEAATKKLNWIYENMVNNPHVISFLN